MNCDYLYYLTIDQYEEWKEYEDILPLERRKRAFSYTQEDDRKRSLLGSFLLHLYTPPVPLTYGPYGKPTKEGCFFSLSHSGNDVVLLLSSYPCGVDIEARKNADASLIRYTLSEKEKKSLRNNLDFISMWTRKEAFAKCLGKGVFGFDGISKVPSEVGLFCYEGKEYVTRTIPFDGNILSFCKETSRSERLLIKKADIRDLERPFTMEWEILFGE